LGAIKVSKYVTGKNSTDKYLEFLPTKELKQDTKIIIKIVVELIGKEMYFQQTGGRLEKPGVGFKVEAFVKALGFFGPWDDLLGLGVIVLLCVREITYSSCSNW
jgi:hypothetical protein